MKPNLFITLAYRFIPVYRSLSSTARIRNMSSTKTYQNAVQDLNSLQSNAAVLEAIRAGGGIANKDAIPEMIEYLGRIGYSPDVLNRLNVIHVTGTKGKGSTSAFVDSILRHARSDWKIGLYTSPHLVAVRERFRINGSPLSEEAFTKYFYEVWNRLHENRNRRLESTPVVPSYFRYLTLMAFHTFMSEKVDATVLEVGVGGTYDSTNVVPKPVAAGVTSLGLDHVHILGKTLPEIAWHKSGIYKEGVPAFAVEQPSEALKVLEQRAAELKASSFSVVSLNPAISGIKLGLPGVHQYQNASLAVELAQTFVQRNDKAQGTLPEFFVTGLKNAKCPGRCQTVIDPGHHRTTWYLDGAHTSESIQCSLNWFVTPDVGLFANGENKGTRLLIFNCTHGRTPETMLRVLYDTMAQRLSLLKTTEKPESFFDHVLFSTNLTYSDGHSKIDLTEVARPTTLEVQDRLASSWSEMVPSFPSSSIHVKPTITDAVQFVREAEQKAEGPIKVLVTGSLLLVGGLVEAASLTEQVL
ncbi:Mur ligase [Amanita muscaria]